jgi:hypothetical protein
MEEQKAQFLAQYLGHDVEYPDTDDKLIRCKLVSVGFYDIEVNYKRKKKGCVGDSLSWKPNGNKHNSDALHAKLLLKSLDKITKEDLIELIKIDDCNNRTFTMNFEESVVMFEQILPTKINEIYIYQYLQYNGYALPWKGYSVREMILAGWIKII